MTKEELAEALNIKAGYLTSELWVTVLTQVLLISVALGLITTADSEAVGGSLENIIGAGFAIFGEVLSVWKYIDSRTKVKVEQQKAVSNATFLEGSTMVQTGSYGVE